MIDETKLVEDIEKWELELKQELEKELGKNAYRYGLNRIIDTLENVIDVINEQPKVGEWIPVEERLPEIQQDVLVTIKRRNISYCDLAFLDDNGRWLTSRRIGYIEGNVLAWQPLPKSYEVKE